MSLFNLGSKDEYGRQRRIEHRGRYLRASRTGGVSLRARTRAAGLNLTANTSHGFRVSRTVSRNTLVAFQNGRFILRGRYGSGPTKMNLSKSGISVSTRNELGTVNWLKPRYSSARVFGMQFRGRTAVVIAAIDNLGKGAAGQAVQNMNLMFGLEETEGLWNAPLYP